MPDQREIDAATVDLAQAAAAYCEAETEFSRLRGRQRDSGGSRVPVIQAEHGLFEAWRAWAAITGESKAAE